MPRLWTATIDTHRRTVRDATLETAATLVAAHGLRSVTMSRIAAETGIGRATLYKYFPDVESILLAWHERRIAAHLEHLTEVRDRLGDADERLAAVLVAYAHITRETRGHGDEDLVALLHRDEQVGQARHKVHEMVRELLVEAVASGDVRQDIAPDELASYCLAALSAAASMRSEAAVRRLVSVTLAGMRPPARM